MVVNFGVYEILCKVFRYRSKIKCIDIASAILITENLKKSS